MHPNFALLAKQDLSQRSDLCSCAPGFRCCHMAILWYGASTEAQ